MTTTRCLILQVALWLSTSGLGTALAHQAGTPLSPDPPSISVAGEAEIDVLTRGPIHEAFAQQINLNPQPGLVVDRAPPAPVRELPPEAKPAGDNVIWIPGYWAWDEERDDYIWISGVWRSVPPSRRWVPGQWSELADGHQWVSGFWTSADTTQFEYYDPPESLDAGPSSPAPSDEYFWIPGCWVYVNQDYSWRPGYWYPHQEDWVWVPARYVWTPTGCRYVDGYWDYRVPLRGQLYAPVYFANYGSAYGYGYRRPLYYTPYYVIDAARLLLHLFVRPTYGHYYFGDYYGGLYPRRAIYPWVDYYRRGGYDPLFAYYRTEYAIRGVDYVDRIASWNRYFERYEDRRPPRSLTAQQASLQASDRVRLPEQSVLARSSREVMDERNSRNRDFVRRPDEGLPRPRSIESGREGVERRLLSGDNLPSAGERVFERGEPPQRWRESPGRSSGRSLNAPAQLPEMRLRQRLDTPGAGRSTGPLLRSRPDSQWVPRARSGGSSLRGSEGRSRSGPSLRSRDSNRGLRKR